MRWNVAACGLMGLLAQSATAITMDIDNDRKDPSNLPFRLAHATNTGAV